MEKILNGLVRFQRDVFPQERELFERLATGQNPDALFLTCSDSRISPAWITQTRPGDLFVCRNAGNIAPAWGEATGGVSATIEYAVLALEVRDIIICGHSDCGAMKALLHPEKLSGMPTVSKWLRHAERARFIVQENYKGLTEQERLNTLTEENVIAQLENLRTHPSVAARVRSGKLQLHGWVYCIENGLVTAYNPVQSRFETIADTSGVPGERHMEAAHV